MNLILTFDSDLSSNDVLEYFFFNKKQFLRINLDNYDIVDINSNIYKDYYNIENDFYLNLNGENSGFGFVGSYNSVWFRRPIYLLNNVSINFDHYPNFSTEVYAKLRVNKIEEIKVLFSFLISNIKSKITLGSFTQVSVNKLITLKIAQSLGMKIPKSIITTSKSELSSFLKLCRGKIITKSMYEGLDIIDKENKITTFTTEVSIENLDKIPNFFSPSLLQEKLNKDFEIRTFYLNGICHSMAIFSQNDKRTEVDYRRYNHSKPNRSIPFTLPKLLEQKIKKLMKKLNLNTGSLDFVKVNNKYYFLEVNPVGQFGQLSRKCNFNLEFKLYKFLNNEK